MYLAKKCIDQNNVTYISMATKYHIIKHRAFFKTSAFFFSSANNEDICLKFLPHINIINKRPLGLKAPLSNNTLSMIYYS